ncbi:MAG: site-specific DNA-methyltransferase [Archaeoglobales archaeon]|nr:MAG: site-specific DNA-methyltransferase [Archaeoglobales archaeon]
MKGGSVVERIFEWLGEPVYYTDLGAMYLGDSKELLKKLPRESVDLVITSPPFPLQREKPYGRFCFEDEFVEWFMPFAEQVRRVLKRTGSFVIDLGGTYVKGRPIRSLYQYRLLIRLCDDLGFALPEEFFWFNPSKLPSPIEWVNKRKIRVKDAVNVIWWLAKDDYPKVRLENVLIEYSDRMKLLLKLGERFYKPKDRPSGHKISEKFMKLGEKKGAIPPNLLVIPNTDSNSKYVRYCRAVNTQPHPTRFPIELPEFFIKFLTDPKDLVVDIFAGSNAVGEAAQALGRCWISIETNLEYVANSAFRFLDGNESAESLTRIYNCIMQGETGIHIKRKCKGILSY